jgi:membrane-bound ClpP family serine protease
MKATVTCLALWFTAFLACASGEKVCLIKINGAIGPATASYISRSIGEAQSQNAQCLIIQLNTPGGLLDSTQVIVQKLLASPVPVVVYVAPIGATATSAGCFITLAASVAAMAPATTIGAARPVTWGGHLWAIIAVEFQQMDATPTEHTVVECNGLKSTTLNST